MSFSLHPLSGLQSRLRMLFFWGVFFTWICSLIESDSFGFVIFKRSAFIRFYKLLFMKLASVKGQERWRELMSSRSEAVRRMMCKTPSRKATARLNGDMSQQADRSQWTFSFSQLHLPSFSCRVASMSQFIWGQMAHSLQRLLVIVPHIFLSRVKEQKWHVGSAVWRGGDGGRQSQDDALRCRCIHMRMAQEAGNGPWWCLLSVIPQNPCCPI